jgi:two-component system invasion response regulator UvrY
VINVLLADEHELLRAGMKSLLSAISGISVVGEASNSDETLSILRKDNNVHVVLMDVKLPGLGCLSTTERIVRLNPDIKVMGTSLYQEHHELPERLLEAGAFGYLNRQSGPQELVNAIRKIYSGQIYLSPEAAQQMALQNIDTKRKKRLANILSNREYEVMKRIIYGERAVDMAIRLSLSAKTINTYRYRIFSKLGLDNDVVLTLAAIRDGIVPGYAYQLDEDTERTDGVGGAIGVFYPTEKFVDNK